MSDQDNETSFDEEQLRTDILSALEELETPSAFAFSAVRPSLPSPGLCIPPYGVLGLPLSKDDAQKIISQARQSPFGKGEETVIDTCVRKSWELNTNQFSLKNPDWHKTEQKILDSVTTELGLKKGVGSVSAELYKLLLYEPGAFFKPHKDSEKTPGMFATLIICLPSPHEGGKLVITFDNEKYEFETAKFSAYKFSFAAWYSDVLHEVLPVTSGYRLVLTYNLIRRTDFEIPSYDLALGKAQELSNLLKQYNLGLEKKYDLPPILIHKLKHKYTQASLQLKSLKSPDLAQVSNLVQVATKLNFCIYLATLELQVNTDEECDDCEEKETCLKNIVDLDGKLILEEMDCPEDALIDPTPQDEDGDADESEHEGYTGNEGSPVTYWYRDTVVFLVPPCQKFSFLFQFSSNGSVIESLFNSLMKEYSKDPAQKPKLEELCKQALNQNISQASTPPFFHLAAATALDVGWFDLFDQASEKTSGKIILDNAHLLGRWAAKNGVAAMSDRLMKGVQAVTSVPQMVQFLKIVAEGFETVLQEPDSVERANLRQWSAKAIFSATAELVTLTKSDAASLAQLCKTIDWSFFETEVMPIISKATPLFIIWFINELMTVLGKELSEEQQTFTETVIRNIWASFAFSYKEGGSALQKTESLNANDVKSIIENTMKILSPECLETTIIPAMLKAVPNASKECSKGVLIPLTRMIVKNEVVGFRLQANDAVPPLLHKHLVQAFLLKYLMENVGLEPQAPVNWSVSPPKRCYRAPCVCGDCAVVNRFLQNPVQRSLDLKRKLTEHRHLTAEFNDSWNSPYKCETIKDGKPPYAWRITKNQSIYERAKAEWMKNTQIAVQTLSELKSDRLADSKLELFLQPHSPSFLNACLKELPDLASLLSNLQSPQTNENVAPAINATGLTSQTVPIGQKRGASQSDVTPAKRSC